MLHNLSSFLYDAAGHLARVAAALAPNGDGKLARTFRARRGIRARYTAWSTTHRDPARPLLWIHAPSVGEGLQAKPVIALLRARHPEWQIAYTFFSPSAESFARGVSADFTDYLPFDTAADAEHALSALRPTALVFSKLDVWPRLVARATARGIPTGMISATLAPGSGRGSRSARLFLAEAYRALRTVGAIDADDANRLVTLGVRRERIAVTGDTRYDQVWMRAHAIDRESPVLAPLVGERPTLVAGSTWPADETPLLEAWATVRARVPDARLIIAPHEPTTAHLQPIEAWAAGAGLRVARLSDLAPAAERATPPNARSARAGDSLDVILVDRVGVLGDLYALADIAYVGGGFHAAGLHSVIEPAAFGAPVLFGPRHQGSRDAVLLISQGGGWSVGSSSDLAMRLLALLTTPNARATAGSRARALVESGLGAADRSAALIERLFTS